MARAQATIASPTPIMIRTGHALRLAAAKALGRQVGQRPSDKKSAKVRKLHDDGLSYRLIARNVGLSKNTVMDIVSRGAA